MAGTQLPYPRDAGAAVRQARAWLLQTGALAVHVLDEALTGFLDFYNPLVLQLRSTLPWLPFPTFTFGVWLGGLASLVIALALLAPAIRRASACGSAACWLLAVLMFFNGLGHLAGSVYFDRWLPGTSSAPLLLAASVLLARRTLQRGRLAWVGAGVEAGLSRQLSESRGRAARHMERGL